MKEQGIPSPKGKSYWDRTTVWGHLKNPAYRGNAIFGKTRIGPKRPRLRAQRGRPEQPRRPHSVYDVPKDQGIPIRGPGNRQRGSLRCRCRRDWKRTANAIGNRGAAPSTCFKVWSSVRRCDYAFYGKPVSLKAAKGKRRDYAYYRCIGTDAYRFGGERVCHNKQVRTDLLDEAVWHDVCSLLENPGRIEREYQRRLKREPGETEATSICKRGFRRSSAASRGWSTLTKTGSWKRATSSRAFVGRVTAWPRWRRRRRSKRTKNRSASNCDW